jgi:hypothetical protein
MVMDYEAWILKTIDIPYEIDNINFYAREIGDFKALLEGKMAQEYDDIKQWYKYFLTYAEIELEAANDRLTENRRQLADYNQQQGELHSI